MMRVPPIIRRIFLPLAPENAKPKYVYGEPTPHLHSSIETEQQKERGWLQTDAMKRLSGR